MLHYLYEQLLEFRIAAGSLPGCVAIVLSSGDLDLQGQSRVRDLLDWSQSLKLGSLILYVDDDTPQIYERIAGLLFDAPADISLHNQAGSKSLGRGGKTKMVVSLGYGGKREVTEAFRKLLAEVEEGRLDADEISESTIESHLRFCQKPDLVIRAGGKQLSDFMIWQAAYSELYFTDVNWRSLRKIDFLRAIRDWQRRERRYGR